MKTRMGFLVVSLFAAACGSGGPDDDAPTTPDQYVFGGDRPVRLEVPNNYDHTQPTPLIVLLHGFGANAFVQTAFLGYTDVANRQGVLFVAPEGTTNSDGSQFWNATDACCDFEGSGVDDVAYLSSLVGEISGVWNVDPRRIYLIGHSNGGFMSYRMACDVDNIAAIVSLAGMTWLDPQACSPTSKTSVLQVHGDQDKSTRYEGNGVHPSARQTVSQWASFNGCGEVAESSPRLDIEQSISGTETRVSAAGDCPSGVAVELWTIEGAGHTPSLVPEFQQLTVDWMMNHPKVQ